jgi:hypothetical protein
MTRILIAGSRMFNAGYRIDRALVRASARQRSRDMHVMHVGRWSSGAPRIARDMADEFGWSTEIVQSVSEAQADICLAFLHTEDERNAAHRIVMMKAEKAGISVWRYHEGGPRHPHPSPGPAVHDDFLGDVAPWEEALLNPAMPVTIDANGSLTFDLNDVTYRIVAA